MASRVIDVTMQLIDKVSQPLSGIHSSLKDSSRQWQNAGKDIMKTGDSISKVGQGMTTAITLPVVAAGTAAMNNFASVDKTLALVEQTMGEAKYAAADLEGALMNAAQNSVFGMNDAAEASLNFARAGFDAKQSAEMVAPAFALAAGTQTDLAAVTEGLGSTLKLFGADTSEAAKYSDIFAQAQAQANTTVQDLFDSTSAAGAMFATVGWTVNDLAVATGVLGDAMVSGSEAGNGLKSGLANLATNDTAIAMLDKLGVSIVNDKGEFDDFVTVQRKLHDSFANLTEEEQINAATALFGKNQMAKWMTIIQKSPDDIQSMTGALQEADGTAQSMSDALMSGTGGAMESLKSSIDVLGYSFGQFIAAYATPVIQKVTQIVDWFVSLDDSTKDMIVRFGGIAAAVGPALLVFGKVVSTVGKVVSVVGKIGSAISSAGGLMAALTGPGAIVIAVIAAIGVAIALVVTHWDQVKAAAQAFFEEIQPLLQFFQEKWQELCNVFMEVYTSKLQPAWEQFKSKVQEVWVFVEPVLKKFAEIAKEVFELRIKTAIDIAVKVFEFLAEYIGIVVETMVGIFSGIVDFVVGVFTGDWDRAWNGVKKIFESIWNGIKDIASAAVDFISGLVSSLVDAWNGLLSIIGLAKDKGSEVQAPSTGSSGNFAVGTSYFLGGTATIHERGAEVVDLPRGTRIWPHDESLKMAYQQGQASGGGNSKGNISITVAKLADSIQVRSDSDIEAIAVAIANKLEQTAHNIGGGELGYIY